MTILSVTSGHPISGVVLTGGEFAYVSSGGVAISTTVPDQTGLTVFSGGVASFTVLSGGNQYVSSGGIATGTLLSGGTEAIDGGTALFSVVSAGGSEDVYAGGRAVGTTLSGGFEGVYAGGTASATVISSGGAEYVYTRGTASGTVVRDAGDLNVNVGGTASGTVVSSGGTVTVDPGANVSFTTISRGGAIDLPSLIYSGGSATVNGTDRLTVIEGANSATLQLAGPYTGETFQTSEETDGGIGTVVTLKEAPRTLLWTGAQNPNFADAANWHDLTNGIDPAIAPPNPTDTAEFLSGGGTIDGTGTAAVLAFGGTASWEVTSGASLTAAANVTVGQGGSGTLFINDGASVNGTGAADDISGAAGEAVSVTVDGAASRWASAGELVVGAQGSGDVTIRDGAGINAAAGSLPATGSLPAMVLGESAGGEGSLLVTGAGSTATLAGQLNVGEAGDGSLTISDAGTVSTGDAASVDPAEGFDIAQSAGGAGEATVTGPASLLTNIGRFVVGDLGLGSLAIDAGATVITAPGAGSTLPGAVIGNGAAAAGSSVDVSGAGSRLEVGGLLDVGVAGSGLLAIDGGASVTAGSLDAAVSSAAVGQISVSGAGTEIDVTGAATVADDGTGVMSVLSGATFEGSSLTIGSQGDSSGALVVSGDGSKVLLSGALNIGTALGTGDLTVGPGASVIASVVNLQGDVVLEGGFLDPTVYIENSGSTTSGFGTVGADYLVLEGTIISNGTKLNKETEVVLGTVVGGGTLAISGGTTADGTAVNGPGILQIGTHDTIELTGAVLNAASTTFTDTQTPTGTYTVTNSVIDVVFQDTTGVLLLDDIAGFGGTIATYHAGDSFVITGGTLSGLGVNNGNTLTFSDAGAHAGAGGIDQIVFGSGISAAGFQIVNGDTVQAVVSCFAAGTLIETERGPVMVEALRIGDRVVVADGQNLCGIDRLSAPSATPTPRDLATTNGRCDCTRVRPGSDAAETPVTGDRPAGNAASLEPIVWLGQRTVNCARHPEPETVWPVRVRAGAFGDGVPRRDLWLSPDHAVFVNEVLIPIKHLINGTTIEQLPVAKITYYHVELPRHAVLLAEGLRAESYLDTGNRWHFANHAGPVALHPDFSVRMWEARACAPLVVVGRELAAVRRRLAEHAVDPRRTRAG